MRVRPYVRAADESELTCPKCVRYGWHDVRPMPDRTLNPGDLYRDEKGRLMLYVRQEVRGGNSVESGAGPGVPEHLFVLGMPEHRHFGTRWLRADEPLPARVELVVNSGADREIAELRAEVAKLQAERAGLVDALRLAISVVAPPVASELRRRFKRARDAEGAE